MSFLGCAVIIFTAFVYNEIIILKFCGFDKNTTDEINIRSLKDFNCDFGKDEDETSLEPIHLQDNIKETNDENNRKI